METVLNFVVMFISILVALPLAVFALEIFIAAFFKHTDEEVNFWKESKFDILIPAHNEEDIIKETITHLLEEGIEAESVLLVADNCSDNTSVIAKALGVRVIERYSDTEKGKSFALEFGFQHLLNVSSADVTVILDADCRITKTDLCRIANKALNTSRPVQAVYKMELDDDVGTKQRIQAFAWITKNLARPLAAHRLKIPVTLTGTGMAFPNSQLRQVNIASNSIVEDMKLGIDLTLLGYAPVLSPNSIVSSTFAQNQEASESQKKRWEHGHLLMILKEVPKLLLLSIGKLNLSYFLLALDILVPPLALLCITSVVLIALQILLCVFYGSWDVLIYFTGVFSLFIFSVLLAWFKYGRTYVSILDLVSIPFYIAKKMSIYTSFIANPEKSWVKTSRKE